MHTTQDMITTRSLVVRSLGTNMKTIEQINAELQEAAAEEREFQLEAEYEDFIAWLHYCYECEQWDYDMEFYNEFG